MKVCAISPFSIATAQEILSFIATLSHELIILPGGAPNHPTIKQIQNNVNPKSTVFVETGYKKLSMRPWIVSKNQTTQMPRQLFAQTPRSSNLDALQNIWAQRTHIISSKKVSFAICGEVDAFTVRGTVKFNRRLPFHILINPTHTVRGRWNHLGRKLSNLSLKKVVVHTANNNKNHNKLLTNLRIYKNGNIRPVHQIGNLSWSECKI
jgi:hypothetical protein